MASMVAMLVSVHMVVGAQVMAEPPESKINWTGEDVTSLHAC